MQHCTAVILENNRFTYLSFDKVKSILNLTVDIKRISTTFVDNIIRESKIKF